jgi:hypothetical protein
VTDPLKLGKSSSVLAESLQRSLIQLQALEAQGNYDVQQRLEQIRSILHGVGDGQNEPSTGSSWNASSTLTTFPGLGSLLKCVRSGDT